jgi:hypothetical protein
MFWSANQIYETMFHHFLGNSKKCSTEIELEKTEVTALAATESQ